MSHVGLWRRSSALLVVAGLVPVLLLSGSELAAGASMSVDASPKRKPNANRTIAVADKAAPTKPGQLSVVSTTASSVTTSWRRSNDKVGVAGYSVYRNGVRIGSTPAATTRFTAPALSCGSSYTLAVDAYDAAGNRSARATVLAATSPCGDAQAPSAPAGVSQYGVDAASITLSWGAATDNFGVVGYDVLRDGELAGSTASTLYAVTGLQCGTMYTLGVRAFDAAGNRSPAANVLLTTSGCSDQTAPSAPPALGVASANETSVSVTWAQSTDGNGVVGYSVYRNGTYVGSTSGTTYTVGGLACGSSYGVSVDAYDAAGNRSARSAVSASTSPCPEPIPVPPADTAPPTVPTGMTITGATASTISLRWTASSDNTGVAGYGLYRDGAGAGSSSLANATFSGLSCGRSYELAVDAYDARGNRSSRVGVVSSTAPCPDTTPPSTPAGLTQSGVTESTVGLGWTPATDNVGVAGYGIYLAGVRIASTSSLAHTFAQLTCGTTYTVGVDAYDAAGSRSARASLVVTTRTCPTTDTQAPTVPQNQSVAGATQSSFTMSWSAATDNVGVTGYAVHLNGARIATTAATSHTYTGLACGTSYTVGLQALDAAGNASDVGLASGSAATSACPGSGDTQAPSAPGALAVGTISQTSVAVTWTPATDNLGVTGYGYYRDGSSVGNGTGSAYTFSGLACGTSYALAVDAYDAAGNRSTRTSATATTSACPPPAPGGSTANLWVDTSGGSCTRQATRGAYSDSQACSWNAAYQAAQTGDLIQVRGGNYGDVTIGPNKASIAAPGVTFQPASGESVTVSDLENGYYTGGASNITFLGPVTSRTFRSDGGSNIVVDGWTVDCGGCDNVQIFHLENASNVTVRNSDISDNYNNSLIWIQGTNLTFDNNVIHDADLRAGSGAHTECMYAWDVTNLRLTRNHFYHCAVMDVFITGSSVSSGGYVENNVFEKPWTSSTGTSNSALSFHFRNGGDPSPNPSNWEFRYNTFVGPLSISPSENQVGSGGMRVVGNVFLSGSPCGHANTTYTYNAFVSGACGTNTITNTLATYLGGFTGTGDPGTYSLLAGSVLRNRGNPGDYPSQDRSGGARYTGSAPDLGAYEGP